MTQKTTNYKKFVATAATATLVASALVPVASANTKETGFTDVAANYKEAVDFLVDNDITSGKSATKFGTSENILRVDSAIWIAKAALYEEDIEDAEASGFTDVPARGEAYVNALKEQGWVNGKDATTFNSYTAITRGEVALILANAYDLKGDTANNNFTDVNDRYAAAVAALKDNGVTAGKTDTKFGTNDAITRGELAVWLYKVAAEEVIGEAAIESVSAINKTTVEVKFNTEVDAVKAENFTIEGASVTSATLSEDKKSATLTVSGLDYEKEYTLVAKDIVVDGEKTDFGEKKFTTPTVTDLWNLEITTKDAHLVADGADNTEVTFTLIDKETGKVDLTADNVVLDLNTTYGTLASKRVTIQDGKATVLLTSEFSNVAINAKIDAQIIEASGDHTELIGKVFASIDVPFITTNVENVNTVTLVSAESNQADRVSLFFDKDVSLKHVVDVNADGELLYNVKDANGDFILNDAGGTAAFTAKQVIDARYTDDKIFHQLKESDTLKVTQGAGALDVKGVRTVPGNSKALEVIFDSANDSAHSLTDNANVKVAINTVNSLGNATPSSVDFKLTDARKPEATSVTTEGLNTLKVKFSESIFDTDLGIDGKYTGKKVATVAKLADAVAAEQTEPFLFATGDFNPVTGQDQRDLATIKLTKQYDEDGIDDDHDDNKTIAGYFTAGAHSLQVSSTKDYAWITDKSNLGTTQTLNFNIAEDKALPTASVVVESPEQIRVKFDKVVNGLAKDDFKVQIFNTKTGEYEDISNKTFDGEGSLADFNDLLEVTPIQGGSEYVLELNKDWTKIYNTKDTRENYYNDKFRIVVKKGQVANVANGLKNEVINLDLNYSGSALNTPDTTSPEIQDVKLISASKGVFEVTMSEPVKAIVNKANVDVPTDLDGQALQDSIVYLYGKDKAGKTVTFTGKVTGYADLHTGADKALTVQWTPVTDSEGTVHTPQSVVDAGGSEDWTVAVANVTDDVGNSASTKVFDFKITKAAAAATPFFVKHDNAAGDARKYDVVGELLDNTKDQLTITFSEGVQVAGTSNATNPTQYTLNGQALPSGTSIAVKDLDGKNGNETVIITLPDGTLNALTTESNTLTINKGLVSYDGSVITGATQFIVSVTDAVDEGLQAIKDAANTAVTASNTALANAAGNAAVAAEITAVQDAKTALQTALAADLTDSANLAAVVTATTNLETATTALTTAIAAAADQLKADAVDTLITALPGAGTVDLADKTAIDAARTAYDDLTLAQQALVADLPALVAAEAELVDASITGIVVKTVAAIVDGTDSTVYNVELPNGTVLADLTAAEVVVTKTHTNASVETAVSTDNGATWTVEVKAVDGTTTETYTINVTVAL